MTSWFYTVIFIFLRMQTILPFKFSIRPRSSCCWQITWKNHSFKNTHVYNVHIILQLIYHAIAHDNWKECPSSQKSLQWIVSGDNKDKMFFFFGKYKRIIRKMYIYHWSLFLCVCCLLMLLSLSPCYKNDNIKNYTHISICKEHTHPAFRQVCTYKIYNTNIGTYAARDDDLWRLWTFLITFVMLMFHIF